MKLAKLEAAMHSKPFRAFELRVDGKIILVRHPEKVFLAEKKSTVIIDTGGRIHICDVSQISKLALLRRNSSGVAAKAG